MTTSQPTSPPGPSQTPASPTRDPSENSPPPLNALFSVAPVPDLESGAILCDRYRIQHSLGKGGFGGVYLALDLELDRKVAIKRQIGKHLADTELARNEAKFIAGLDHPSIVKVFDLINDQQEGVLIIMEYVNGLTLHEFLKRKPVSIARALALATEIAQALVHAHSRRIVHRDLKPSNVLLDQTEKVKLSDFGLALGAINLETAPSAAGTPKYMAPEQVRGESNRIDGRTDLWALGVILYEMLGGAPPFSGLSRGAIFEAILYDDPLPLRQLNPRVPEEIERIVERCLRKRMSERPASASDLVDDLLSCHASAKSLEADFAPSADPGIARTNSPELKTPRTAPSSSHLRPLHVEPKGLRPYSEDDGLHYLDLVPGPRERSGLPESIHYWKKWASCENVDEYASVGVLYGPSGAGKTSFVRAGLLNQLDNDICPIFVECRAGDLMGRIETAINARFHQKSRLGSLSKLLSVLRDEEGGVYGYRKILIILDQFESWSTSATAEERRSLAEALRHCDGKVLQCLFVVRDDYWSGITEIMQWIDVPLVENRNVRSLESLDPRHAQRVLEGMGRSHGTLPPSPTPLTSEQQLFIRQAIEGLAENGRIVAVHLVMFAQIVRVIPWTPQMLRKQGGVTGACSAYLHQIFESSAAPPAYRRLAGVVVEILGQLLPTPGDALKASAKSREEIRNSILAAGQGAKFDEAIRILSEDLKLISPTRDEAEEGNAATSSVGYQLSHDFLVEPVRKWVELFRKSTWRGRAIARLAELSDLWQRKPQRQFLPTLREYAAMSYVVPSSARNEKQTKYLRAAGRYHVGKAAGMTIATVVAVFFAVLALQQYLAKQEAERKRIGTLFDVLDHGTPDAVQGILDELVGAKKYAREFSLLRLSSIDPKVRLRAAIFLYLVDEPSYVALASSLGAAEKEFAPEILKAFEDPRGSASLQSTVDDQSLDLAHRARAALVLLHAGSVDGIERLLSPKSNSAERDALLKEAAVWRGQPTDFQRLLAKSASTDLHYVALAMLGYYKESELSLAIDWQRIEEIRDPANPMLDSAAEWLLKRNGKIAARKDIDETANVRLFRSSIGIELIKIDPGSTQVQSGDGSKQALKVDKPLLVSKSPIERRFYGQFLAEVLKTCDGAPMPPLRPNPELADDIENHPERAIRGIAFDRSIEFCNWLSEKDGLSKCYFHDGKRSITNEANQTFDIQIWKVDPNANGYRLPTVEELEYLIFANDTTESPWTIAEQIETVSRNQPLNIGLANPRLSRDVLPSQKGFFLFEADLFYYVQTKEMLPAVTKLAPRRFYFTEKIQPKPSLFATMVLVRNAP